jgi:endonuclease/exonuclease/phosphatase family metal-dependent hydrolase
MIFAIVASVMLHSSAELPYARDIVLQSADAIQSVGTTCETTADTDLNRFVQRSQKNDFANAYQTWSDLLFNCVSSLLELIQILNFPPNDQIQLSAYAEIERLHKVLQQKLLTHPTLFATFLRNAGSATLLTPQQRLFTQNILREYQRIFPNEASKIDEALKTLSPLKTEPFIYAKGLAAPVNPDKLSQLKVFTANICSFPGTLTYLYGGISPWKERIDQLVEVIRNAGAQIVCLQEVWDPAAMRALADRLKNDYAFFIYDTGDPAGTIQVDKMGFSSGLFIASKLQFNSIAYTRFPGQISEGSNRGMLSATCDVAKTRLAFITTHLQYGSSPPLQQERQDQLFLCYASLQEAISREPADRSWGFLVGDLNINAFSQEFSKSGLSRLFSIPYITQLSVEKATCTGYFSDLVLAPLDKRDKISPSYELIDYCIRPTLSPMAMTPVQTLIPLYHVKAPTEALSDHQALLTTWTLTPPAPRPTKTVDTPK